MSGIHSAYGFPQFMVNQSPKFDNVPKKRRKNGNQVISRKSGIIRPDKRTKPHYL